MPSETHAALVSKLEAKFRELSLMLYDTSIDPATVDAEITPLLDENIRFTDPWQQASGRDKYRLGAAGFHALLRFDLSIRQVNVSIELGDPSALRAPMPPSPSDAARLSRRSAPSSSSGAHGRCIVDGVMHLRPLGPLFTYPLRTILVYQFVLDGDDAQNPTIRILQHEEMWSIADMIAAVPGVGRVYREMFRPAFSVGFLAASWLGARAKGFLPARS